LDEFRRKTLSGAEFDAVCRRLEELRPDLSQTSGTRTTSRNREKGGDQHSAHLEGLARDYKPDVPPQLRDGERKLERMAKTLGLWALYHRGHLHVQGRAPREQVLVVTGDENAGSS